MIDGEVIVDSATGLSENAENVREREREQPLALILAHKRVGQFDSIALPPAARRCPPPQSERSTLVINSGLPSRDVEAKAAMCLFCFVVIVRRTPIPSVASSSSSSSSLHHPSSSFHDSFLPKKKNFCPAAMPCTPLAINPQETIQRCTGVGLQCG